MMDFGKAEYNRAEYNSLDFILSYNGAKLLANLENIRTTSLSKTKNLSKSKTVIQT